MKYWKARYSVALLFLLVQKAWGGPEAESNRQIISAEAVQLPDGRHAYKLACTDQDAPACVQLAQRYCQQLGEGSAKFLHRFAVAPLIMGSMSELSTRARAFECVKQEVASASDVQVAAVAVAASIVPQSASAVQPTQPVLIGSVNFKLASAQLPPTAKQQLEELLVRARNQRFETVKVSGFADATGSDASNVRLSQARAESVARYLQEHGLQADRYELWGYGSANPVAHNLTATGRAQNRRAEIALKPASASSAPR